MSATDKTQSSTITTTQLASLYDIIGQLEELTDELAGDIAAELDDLTARLARYAATLTRVSASGRRPASGGIE